jgi:SAM-dependent methyltransferase
LYHRSGSDNLANSSRLETKVINMKVLPALQVMDNYEFCARFAGDAVATTGGSILDFGCGAGQIVRKLRERQFNAYGCDDFSLTHTSNVFADMVPYIKTMNDGHIPFKDNQFEIVLSNQVFEHVADLNATLREIYRVLKPNGMLLSLFPDNMIWREGHTDIPFLHWFSKGSRLRFVYARTLVALGLGVPVPDLSASARTVGYCDYLDRACYYRPYREILDVFQKYFGEIQHIESYWLSQRVGVKHIVTRFCPELVQTFIVRKAAGMVFTCRKSGARDKSCDMGSKKSTLNHTALSPATAKFAI